MLYKEQMWKCNWKLVKETEASVVYLSITTVGRIHEYF